MDPVTYVTHAQFYAQATQGKHNWSTPCWPMENACAGRWDWVEGSRELKALLEKLKARLIIKNKKKRPRDMMTQRPRGYLTPC